MAFLGQEYKLVKHENYGEFLKSLGIPNDQVQELLKADSSEKLVKNGDSYTFSFTMPQEKKDVIFKSGVELDEIDNGETIKSTYTVEGNMVHQVARFGGTVADIKREYNGNDLLVTMKSDKWDGVARAFYKAQ